MTEHQVNVVIRHLRDDGMVSAHHLIYQHGITRAATYICELRKLWGEDTIQTRRGVPGDMATYLLVTAPASWDRPPRKRRTWACTTCGQVRLHPSDLERRTPSMARGLCPTCGADRLFRFG